MIQRKSYIDVMRGIAIFFVVFGHVVHIPELRVYIWGFIGALFFFISGVVFNPDKYNSFKQLFVKKFRALIIPYFFFYLITFLYWLVIERNIRGGVSPGSQLVGLIYGTYNLNYNYFNGALWFLPCLFTTELLYYWVYKVPTGCGKLLMLTCLIFIGVLLIFTEITWLPWGINAALFVCFFYGIGNLAKNKLCYIEKMTWKHFIPVIAICGTLQYFLLDYSNTDFAILKISSWYVFIGIIGICVYLPISLMIQRNRWIEFLGVNSLVIFAFQEQTYRIVIFLFAKLPGWDIELVRNDLWMCLIVSFITLLIISPLILLYNRFIRPVISK